LSVPELVLTRRQMVTSRIRLLRPVTERVVVLGVAVGAFTAGSLLAWKERNGASDIPFDDMAVLDTLAFELVIALLLVPFLWMRGWRVSHVTAAPVARDVSRGVGVWLLAYLSYVIVWMLMAALSPEAAGGVAEMRFVGAVSWPVLLLVVVINPVFEEFLFLGYTVSALREYGMPVAAIASVGLRSLVHVYQGPFALLAIAPIGVVLLYSYLRRGSIWPAIVAHAVLDGVALVRLTSIGGD
jgi:membrane protease YdiL (CAAX protease family)